MPAETFDIVYDIESAVEAAFKLLFAEDGLTAYTINQLGETQKERPRVELMYANGAETGHTPAIEPHHRQDTFLGSMVVAVVTNSKDESIGIAEHAQFRGRVRNIMAKSRTQLKTDREGTDTILPHHCILDVVESGTSPAYSPEDGHLVSRISYELKVNIRPDAWPAEA